MLGPLALATEDGLYTIAPCLASSKLHSGSSFLEGALLPNIAFLNPAFSNAFCQSLTP